VVKNAQEASVILTDKENYQQSTIPTIFLQNVNCKVDKENNYFTIIALPLKIVTLKNGLQKMFIKTHQITRSTAVETSEPTLAQQIPISILVAEDNTINQKLMNKSLSFYGYTADIAANGLEVIQALERQSYDLIFMDLQMPEMDGLEATKQIVSRYKDNRPIIVAMTASALGIDKDACFEAGMDDYVSKPIKIDILEEMIIKWCGGKKSAHPAI
jgi:CheY-like chemotaxis protein